VEDVTVAQEDLNTWKTETYTENSQTLGRKPTWTKILPSCGLPQAVSILRRKVLQSPCKTGGSKPEIMRSTAYEGGVIEKCRKCDKADEKTEHGTAGCSSLSEFANIGRHNQLAKIIQHQIAIKFKLLDILP
jgi:hypothetical protein